MSTVRINTSDTAWMERQHAVTAADIVTYGTDVEGAVYFQVEIEVETVEHVEFAGAKMIRFDLGSYGPNDHSRGAMYPATYLVRD